MQVTAEYSSLENELLSELNTLLTSGSAAVKREWRQIVDSQAEQLTADTSVGASSSPLTPTLKKDEMTPSQPAHTNHASPPSPPKAQAAVPSTLPHYSPLAAMQILAAVARGRQQRAFMQQRTVRKFVSQMDHRGASGLGLSLRRHGSNFRITKLNNLNELGWQHPALKAQPSLMEGDLLTAINGVICHSSAELTASVKAGGPLLQLQVERYVVEGSAAFAANAQDWEGVGTIGADWSGDRKLGSSSLVTREQLR